MISMTGGVYQENSSLREELQRYDLLVRILVKKLGGRVTVKNDEYEQMANAVLKIYLDGDMNRVLEVKG